MARRFQFRLHALLRLREAMETQAQRSFGRLLQAQSEIEAQLGSLQQERTATFEARRSPAGEPVDLLRWRLVERYLVVLERREVQLQEALQTAVQRTEAGRAALVKARQDRMMMVRLMERRKVLHDQETERKERLEVDDLAVIRSRLVAAPRPA